MVYVLLNVVDVVLALVYLAVDHHQLIELLADVLAVFLQGFLLFLDFPLDVGPLALQLLYRRVGICHRGAFFRLGVAGLCLLGLAVHLAFLATVRFLVWARACGAATTKTSNI